MSSEQVTGGSSPLKCTNMKMTAKRLKAIKEAEDNIPDLTSVLDIYFKINYLTPIGLASIKEESDSIAPEEAFFNYTEKGIKPESCSNVRRLARLIWGHRRIALNDSMARL